ncbi:MAG: hypothetical protein LBK45_04790, partial [Tannerellaceae bacterium]|nr:hypothetical protein [Tannerellaceae bacterium]
MRSRYGKARNFLDVFTPQYQAYAAEHAERAYTGVAPSLLTVERGYSAQVLEVFLCVQLEDLNMFAGVKAKLPIERQRELARLIRVEYPKLKASEVLLFFQRLKCGRYGRFYGMVDALFITSALAQFMHERRADLIRIDEERKEREKAAQPESKGITYAEYLREK